MPTTVASKVFPEKPATRTGVTAPAWRRGVECSL